MNKGSIVLNFTKYNRIRSIKTYTCWSCKQNVTNLISNLFCSNCKVLQRPEKLDNYFQVLGVKETYDLNDSDLARNYKDLQKHLHPDKYANRIKEEQEISAQYSSLVNDAYKTLLEPLSRGIYMLKLRGKEISENTEVGQEFLMKIMEKNEEVENAETKEEILKLNKENRTIINDLQKQLSKAFYEGDLKRVQKLLSHMKYYTSIDNQIQALIRNKGIIQ
ncbi:iron-sulfur cluster co-chaperone protein HscB [Danaus plexippus]|uniref:Co-chaperone protein HscB n=1 Tax=Danaus plexippus plexippus TaxID=278856 RepID=A0A212FN23_DANPL|nr:iron-sulfur cluster co-chaperone protein HscB [Danaus plexippus]OWR55123.1 Co-chaperone protein HscB [Danaus plexippus plexippus]